MKERERETKGGEEACTSKKLNVNGTIPDDSGLKISKSSQSRLGNSAKDSKLGNAGARHMIILDPSASK